MLHRLRRRIAPLEWKFVAALVLALPLIIPFLADGLPDTADSEIHLHRIISAAVNVDAGYLYPRWTPYLHHGYGYPIHNFYAPGIHLMGAWIYLLTRWNVVVIWKLIQIAATLLYPAGAYLFARTFAGRSGALVAAAVYTCAPFRFDELWLQSNLSQFTAMALLPFLFWQIARGAAQPQRRSVAFIGAFFGVIILLHHPTGFLIAPFAGVYATFMSIAEAWPALAWRNLILRLFVTFGGLILGAGLSAAFWLPALAEFRYVQINSIQTGTFNAAANLISLTDLLRPIVPIDRNLQNIQRFFTPGQPQIVIALAVPFTLVLIRFGYNLLRLYSLKFESRAVLNVVIGAMFLALCLFLMTPASAWVWENLPVARLVVYPWRLLGVAALAAIPGAASLPEFFPSRWQNTVAGILMAIFSLAALPLLYTPLSFYSVTEFTPAEAYIYEIRTGNMGLTSGNEYLPVWVQERPQGGNPRHHIVFEWRVDLFAESIPPDVTYQRITEACSRGSTCYELMTPQDFTLLFNQMYFPGWLVTLDEQVMEVRPEGIHGLIALDIPAGTHRLTIRYGGTTIQHIGELISLISLAIAVVLATRTRYIVSLQETFDAVSPWLATGVVITITGFVVLNQVYLLPATDFMRPAGNPDNPPAQHLTHIQFGDALALVGYDLSTESASPGDTVQVTLYWHLLQATTISPRASVQLTDIFGAAVWARADSISIAGQNFVNWPPGKYAIDRYTLQITPDALPYIGQIRVSVYTQSPDIQYMLTPEGADFVVLAEFRVSGNRLLVSDEALTLQHITYAGAITLRGTTLMPGENGQQCILLRWQKVAEISVEYTVLLHLLDAAGTLLTAVDAPPLDNLYPTNRWQNGQTLDDEHCFAVPSEAVSLAVGLYDRASPVAVPAVDGSGSPMSNHVLILPLE